MTSLKIDGTLWWLHCVRKRQDSEERVHHGSCQHSLEKPASMMVQVCISSHCIMGNLHISGGCSRTFWLRLTGFQTYIFVSLSARFNVCFWVNCGVNFIIVALLLGFCLTSPLKLNYFNLSLLFISSKYFIVSFPCIVFCSMQFSISCVKLLRTLGPSKVLLLLRATWEYCLIFPWVKFSKMASGSCYLTK